MSSSAGGPSSVLHENAGYPASTHAGIENGGLDPGGLMSASVACAGAEREPLYRSGRCPAKEPAESAVDGQAAPR